MLDDGSAAERFGAMVAALGGPADFVENPRAPPARRRVTRPVAPERPGYVDRVDARAVGLVVTGLGGNRRREDDQIDYGVGLSARRPDRRRGRPGPPAGDRPRPRRRERRRRPRPRCCAPSTSAPEPPAERPRRCWGAYEPPARRAARPPRGDGPAGADPEARRAQRAEGPRRRLRRARTASSGSTSSTSCAPTTSPRA